MENLPRKLSHLTLDISNNNFDIIQFGKFIQYLPPNLQYLKVYIQCNEFGDNEQNKLKKDCYNILTKLKKFDLIH